MIQFTSLLEDTQNPGLLSELLSARHDSEWQTIVRRHVIQAEIITRERRASPSRQPEEQRRMWSNGMRKDVEQWNLLRVLDGGPLPASGLNAAENLSYFFWKKKVSAEMDLRIKCIYILLYDELKCLLQQKVHWCSDYWSSWWRWFVMAAAMV